MSARPTPATRLRRRHLLAGAAAFALCGALPRPAGAATDDALRRFMHVSRVVTGKRVLNPEVGRRILEVLSAGPSGPKLQALAAAVERSGAPPGQDIARLLKTEPFAGKEVEEAARELASAWYLGVTGPDDDPAFITYTEALMWRPVLDVHNIPSFCGGVPGFWTEPPRPYPNPWM